MSRTITLVSLFQNSRNERVLPRGCLWLRASLEANGVGVDLRDFQFLSPETFGDPEALADLLDDSHDLIGISTMADSLPLAVALCRRLKERRPERLNILGGWGPTTIARDLIAAFPWIDVVVRGEGERVLPDLIEGIEAGDISKVASIDGRLDGEIVHTKSAPPIADLDALPAPRIDDLDLSAYAYYSTTTARGCPHQCAFCEISTVEQRRVRRRSVESVVSELVLAHREHGVEDVSFQDDIFLLSHQRVDAILDGLEREGVRFKWGCFARAGQVNRKWYAQLRKRGLDRVSFGIESGSDALLDRITKGLTVEQAFSGITDATLETTVRCFFMWGFPQESLTDFFGTAQAIFHAELLGAAVEVGHVVPLAGSPLYLAHAEPLELYESFPFCRLIAPPSDPELFALVRDHPRIFSAFYAFPTPDREEKWRLAGKLCCRT